MKPSESKIIVLSGPSGAGKTTLLDKLFLRKAIRSSFLLGVSCTTREKRPGEKEGRDYFFIKRSDFLKRKKKNFFLEYQKVGNNYYGTPKDFLKRAKKENKDLILCIDVKGGMYLKKNINREKIATIFVSVPSTKELLGRLKKRKEPAANIKKRIKLAKKELQFIKEYDYLIINQNITNALKLLEAILITERLRRNLK